MSFKQLRIADMMDHIRFKGQYIAYTLSDSGYTVVLHNICTGCVETYRDEARQPIGDVILTSTLFAFRANGVLYWKRLSESKESIKKVRLPSEAGGLAGGDGDLIAMLIEELRFTASDSQLKLFTFDATTLQLRSQTIFLDNERLSHRLEGSLLVDAAKHIVDIFYLRQQQGTTQLYACLQHVRISLDGSILQHQTVQVPAWPYLRSFQPPQSIGLGKLYTIRISPDWRSPGVRVLFDGDRGMPINDTDLASVVPAAKVACALWKGSVFCAAKAQASPYDCERRSFGKTVNIDATTGRKLSGR